MRARGAGEEDYNKYYSEGRLVEGDQEEIAQQNPFSQQWYKSSKDSGTDPELLDNFTDSVVLEDYLDRPYVRYGGGRRSVPAPVRPCLLP